MMLIPDRENVIKAWEDVLSRDPLDAPWDLIDDTLALLKAQEPVKPEIGKNGCGSYWYICPECRLPIAHKDMFCRHCGRRLSWDDA